MKIVLKVENRSCGRFLFWGAFVVAGLGFCRCVRVFWGLKLVLFFLPSFWWWFLGSVGFGGGFCGRNSVISFPEKLEVYKFLGDGCSCL